jgi:hypothetical protein
MPILEENSSEAVAAKLAVKAAHSGRFAGRAVCRKGSVCAAAARPDGQ